MGQLFKIIMQDQIGRIAVNVLDRNEIETLEWLVFWPTCLLLRTSGMSWRGGQKTTHLRHDHSTVTPVHQRKWEEILKQQLFSNNILICSMRARIEAYIAKERGHTHYWVLLKVLDTSPWTFQALDLKPFIKCFLLNFTLPFWLNI